MTEEISALTLESPLGPLTLMEDDGAIVKLAWCKAETESDTTLLKAAGNELKEYFTGDLKMFSVPLNPAGTEFQKSVWHEICQIPYGIALTYGEVAKNLSSSPRAVGSACGRNPIPIIIPCHRIVGANGHLTGYTGAGGTETKSFLLDLESDQKSFSPGWYYESKP